MAKKAPAKAATKKLGPWNNVLVREVEDGIAWVTPQPARQAQRHEPDAQPAR